jgi:hypothetical protein
MKYLSVLIVSILLISCGEKIVQSPVDFEQIEKVEFTTYSVNGYFPEFTDVSSDSLIEVKVNKDSTKANNRPKRNIFLGIIKKLALDSSQTIKANELLIKHEECIKSCLTSLKLEEKKIMDSSKSVRDSIKKSLDSGLISRLDARNKMTELNKSVKEKLMALNAAFKVKNCMESCDQEFIKSFSLLLDPEQLKKFNNWIFHNNPKKDKTKG